MRDSISINGNNSLKEIIIKIDDYYIDEMRIELLDKIKLFILDMDGTFYLGDNLIDGAMEFVESLEVIGKDYIFFTNNSSTTSSKYIEKLMKLGLAIDENKIMTSGDVTIKYLIKEHGNDSIYLLGTPELRSSFIEAGIELSNEANVVVVAFDKTLTYEGLEHACSLIRGGASFIATHPDINCPMPNNVFIPDCGAICTAITASTNVEPHILGKPYKDTLDMILSRTGYKAGEVAFVGDRLYTDVATGVNNGAYGILVLSGEATIEDVVGGSIIPSGIFAGLGDMLRYI